jgi:hypothetical protein
MEQNLALALLLAVLGGLTQVICVFTVAYPEFYKYDLNKDIHPCLEKIILPVNFLFQVISGLIIAAAPIFGPVSIVVPVRVGSQLLFNMIIFGLISKMESFDKSARVGTYFVAIGAFLISIVGPTTQEQDPMELLRYPHAMAWAIFMVAAEILSVVINTVLVKPNKIDGHLAFLSLLSANILGATLGASVAKTMGAISGWQAWTAAVTILLLCFFAIGQSTVLQASRVNQKTFVPALACGNQIFNAATGLIIWEDWKVVQSWPGYAAVTLQIVMGVYLISNIESLSNTVDPNYGLSQSLKIMGGSKLPALFDKDDDEGYSPVGDVSGDTIKNDSSERQERKSRRLSTHNLIGGDYRTFSIKETPCDPSTETEATDVEKCSEDFLSESK